MKTHLRLTIMALRCGIITAALAVSSLAWANVSSLPQQLQGVQVRKSLGQSIAMNQTFTDSEGKSRRLQHYFDGKKPVILTLNYFQCPMLCTLQLNGVVKALKKLPADMLGKFRIVTISFNAKEKPALAKKKRATYLKYLGIKNVQWDFLVGTRQEIRRLTKSVGFTFRYLPQKKQFAHPAVIYVMTPKAKVSQYLSGLTYNPRDLRFSLITASHGKIGTFVDKFVMSCFVYDVVEGKYTAFAFGMVRLGGVLTVAFLVVLLSVMWLREYKRQQVENET